MLDQGLAQAMPILKLIDLEKTLCEPVDGKVKLQDDDYKALDPFFKNPKTLMLAAAKQLGVFWRAWADAKTE